MDKYRKLIDEMSLDEKIGMIHGCALFHTKGVERLGILPLSFTDGPMGVRCDFKEDEWQPIGNSDDYATYFPSNTALANTFNPDLAYELGCALGEEARGRGKDILLAPGINIQRSPLCGRNFEYLSEDPKLIEELSVPIIQGIQKQDVAACVKHFAVNGQETNRLHVDTEIDERALHEIYLKGFKAAVTTGGCLSLMGAYNKIGGLHCCHHPYLLDEVLRKDWGFKGVVISDWGGVHSTKEAAETSLDIEMSVTNQFHDYYMAEPLKTAVEKGEILESHIDEKVYRILHLMDRLKMLDYLEHKHESRIGGNYNTKAHRELCLEIARESIVLLKNDNQLLPIRTENLKQVLVIGDNANRLHANAGGSGEIKALYELSPLMGIRMHLGGNVQVNYAKGYYVPNPSEEQAENWQANSLDLATNQDLTPKDSHHERTDSQVFTLKEEALELAKNADCVLFIGGLNHDFDTEGKDRTEYGLPYFQDELIKALLKIRPDTVFVMIAGSPVDMGCLQEAKGIIWSSYNGMEGGLALAEVLFGAVNPSGKLAQTIPNQLNDIPAHGYNAFGHEELVSIKEGIYVGYRHFDTYKIKPAFCFGHGLSYTHFEYRNLCCEEKSFGLVVQLEVVNTGNQKGAETVQIYMGMTKSNINRPKHELKAFKKIWLEPKESITVSLIIKKTDLTYYDIKRHDFVMEQGEYIVEAAASSRDIRLTETIYLTEGFAQIQEAAIDEIC